MRCQEEMNQLVPEKLREIENDYGITILWAVESGSRAWGFASPDSDFDVRFIYRRRQEDYLALNPGRDVIELPVDEVWDVNGWDLDKALKLLYKSNPTLFEWLQSPIVYHQDRGFIERFRELSQHYFSEKKMLHHYLNTAKHQLARYLSGPKVKPKKYFYALRPVLACRFIEKYHAVPPILFDDLVKDLLPEEMATDIAELLEMKVNGPEGLEISPIPSVHDYLEQEIRDLEVYVATVSEAERNWELLNQFFLEELRG